MQKISEVGRHMSSAYAQVYMVVQICEIKNHYHLPSTRHHYHDPYNCHFTTIKSVLLISLLSISLLQDYQYVYQNYI